MVHKSRRWSQFLLLNSTSGLFLPSLVILLSQLKGKSANSHFSVKICRSLRTASVHFYQLIVRMNQFMIQYRPNMHPTKKYNVSGPWCVLFLCATELHCCPKYYLKTPHWVKLLRWVRFPFITLNTLFNLSQNHIHHPAAGNITAAIMNYSAAKNSPVQMYFILL